MTSVTWTAPPVRRHTRYASTVPNASSPARGRPRGAGGRGRASSAPWCRRSRDRSASPVSSRTRGPVAGGLELAAQRRRCGGPATRSRCGPGCRSRAPTARAVSRWLVMPDRRDRRPGRCAAASACGQRRRHRAPRCPPDRARPSPAGGRSGGTPGSRARARRAPRRAPARWSRWCPGRSRSTCRMRCLSRGPPRGAYLVSASPAAISHRRAHESRAVPRSGRARIDSRSLVRV